ncbi:uncharacterized protein [Bemisia tabaci]
MLFISQAHPHDLRERVPYGDHQFPKMVTDNRFIVDKTSWIGEALTGPRLKLITRPRRFGKTTNLSMLRTFLAKDEKAHPHDLRDRVPYGDDQFPQMVTDNRFIVDKTSWIGEALTGPKLKLITRPRRFGKTTNLSMLGTFLTKDEKAHPHDLRDQVPFGEHQFQRMVMDDNIIVDKTPWIGEALTGPKLKLITRPRRFGKTTNLSMLRTFLTKDEEAHPHDLRDQVPFGEHQFQRMVMDDNIIVDKTPWIGEALTGPKLKLITRPRRFGKTTNLSMLETFLTKDEKVEAMDFFAGFSIQNDTKFEKIRMKHQHKYAVFHFSLLSVSVASTALEFEKALLIYLRDDLLEIFVKYDRLLEPREKERLKHYLRDKDGGLQIVLRGYSLMIRKLQANGYKIAVLIDEYDAPFHLAIEKVISETAEGKPFGLGEFYSRIVILMRKFYSFFFKDGLKISIDCGVIIGITYVAKSSIFSDLPDFMAYTTLDDYKFGPYFGFLDHEVKWLIDSSGTNLTFEGFEEWYDGYHYAGNVIFNPYAVVSAIHNGVFDDYWAESGSLRRIRHLIKCSGKFGMLDLYFLLSGRSLRKELYRDLIFENLIQTEESYWTLMTHVGYVDAKPDMQSSENYYLLRIPNKELKEYLTRNFKNELDETKQIYDRFAGSFNNLNNDASDFNKIISDRFNTRAPAYMLHEKASLETLINVFRSLFSGFDFDHRSLGNFTLNETPAYQIVFVQKEIAHVFNIAKVDAVSAHNTSHNLEQLLNKPLIKENLTVSEKLKISKAFKTAIMFIKKAGRDVGSEAYWTMIKSIGGDGIKFMINHFSPTLGE